MSQSGYVHIDVHEVLAETDRAFRVRVGGEDGDEHWFPKSQIADWNEYYKGLKNCTMSIREWLAKEKGIEGE